MIAQITIENFKSIKNEVVFSFEATNFREHPSNVTQIGKSRILKSTVVYGANASGKSNVLMALSALDYLVLNSADFAPDKSIGPYEPFLLDYTSKKLPVKIELAFYIDTTLYTFRVEYLEKEIVKEELFFRPKSQRSVIYSRIKGSPIQYGEHYRGERKSVERKLLPNQLFLSKAVIDNVQILIPVFRYFANQLASYPFFSEFDEHRFHQLYAERLADTEDTEFNEKFNRIICALDMGITRVQSENVDWNQTHFPDELPDAVRKKIKEDYQYRIKALHDVYDNGKRVGEVYFSKEEESKGTQTLFALAGIIIDVLEEGAVLVVDEFEKNLHPHITKSLIKLFHDPVLNRRNAQLIFATHDISQLDSDLFRRDQIWFVEKNERGETDLFSLADIKGVRSNIPFDKWYDSGKFGATPLVDDLALSM